MDIELDFTGFHLGQNHLNILKKIEEYIFSNN